MAEPSEKSEIYKSLAKFLSTSGFQGKLFDFLQNECSQLEVRGEGEEQTLEMYATYQKYCALFEGEFEKLMEIIGVSSMQEMQEKLSAEMTESEQSNKFYQGLLASMEYIKFAQLVKDFNEAGDDDDWDDDDEEDGSGEAEGEREEGDENAQEDDGEEGAPEADP